MKTLFTVFDKNSFFPHQVRDLSQFQVKNKTHFPYSQNTEFGDSQKLQ